MSESFDVNLSFSGRVVLQKKIFKGGGMILTNLLLY
jgi:hypothetical protein